MPAKFGSALITGGAGFLGSFLVERLLEKCAMVKVFDNLSSGSLTNLSNVMDNPRFRLIEADLLNRSQVARAVDRSEIVFHLAATTHEAEDDALFESNVIGTRNLLDAICASSSTRKLCFTSSSAVYGQASVLPTAENSGPLKPTSMYGASKLACEALVCAYSLECGFASAILRLGNVLGRRRDRGVVYDLVSRLRKGSPALSIRGTGKQTRPYILVDDCLDAMELAVDGTSSGIEIFNVASSDCLDVLSVARIIAKEAGLEQIPLVPDHITRAADVERVWLDVSRLSALGWRPRHSSEFAVRAYVRDLLDELQIQGSQ